MIRLVFLLLASLGLLAALGTVLARNLVHAALFLVAFFFVVACQFVLLEVDFLAAIQVLIYIGAVAILLLFGIMLTRNIQGDETTSGSLPRLIPAGVVALGFAVLLILGIQADAGLGARPSWSETRTRPDVAVAAQAEDARTEEIRRADAMRETARWVGIEMMTRYVVAFEVAGLLLTAAVVGAIALAAGDRQPRPALSSSDAEPPATTSPEPTSTPR